MKKNLLRFGAALLALLMVFCIAGCKSAPDGDDGSEYSYYTYVEGGSEYVVTNTEGNGGAGTASDGTAAGKTAGKTNQKAAGGKVDAEKYRGTTVRYATWKDPYKNEDGAVVDSFKKKYGINVEIVTVSQDTYVQTIAGYVAAGNSPDVFFDNCFFPSSLAVLQPITAMQLDLSDPIWDQGMIKMSTINGKPFLVNTIGNIWAEVDCLFYNKKIFKQNGITTPEDYVKKGSWTFDALTKCMTDVKNAGYVGGYIDVQSLLASTGSGFYKYQNGKFSNGVDNMTANVLTRISNWINDGLIRNVTEHNLLNNFINGKAGIAITNAFGLKATGYFSEMNPDDIGFTYIPAYDAKTKAKTTGLFRGWGLIRGAKNPVAAGLFVRHYLDVNNYDSKSAFINEAAQKFFFELTSGVNTDDKNPYMLLGITSLCNEDTFDYTGVAANAPGQVSGALSAINNKINANAAKVNAEIDKQMASLGLK